MSTMEARLRAENETLREQVRQLQGMLCPRRSPPVAWNLTPQEARVFSALVARELASIDSLRQVARKNPDSDGLDMVRQLIMRIRRKTAAFGVSIQAMPGYGYRLEDRARWARLLS